MSNNQDYGDLFSSYLNPEQNGKINEEKKNLLDKYFIKEMADWNGANADLIITDPPFGIEFSGKNGNYNRNVDNVVDGYVEWPVLEYGEKIK
ncbi:MAG TPA: hypothetical protein PLW02_06940, partial [Verrucomicrobiota bacterium]|nr:hypothetical protein [Verrucomicrobiota bacterium]